jgi:hypothetical protein
MSSYSATLPTTGIVEPQRYESTQGRAYNSHPNPHQVIKSTIESEKSHLHFQQKNTGNASANPAANQDNVKIEFNGNENGKRNSVYARITLLGARGEKICEIPPKEAPKPYQLEPVSSKPTFFVEDI